MGAEDDQTTLGAPEITFRRTANFSYLDSVIYDNQMGPKAKVKGDR